SLKAAQAALDAGAKQYNDQKHPYRGPHGEDPGFGVMAVSLRDELLGSFRFGALFLFGSVSALLLIAFVNVWNLLLVRAVAREKETTVRRALGASNRQLARQWMTESAILALLGGSCGALAAQWMVRALAVLTPVTLPSVASMRVDARVLTFT